MKIKKEDIPVVMEAPGAVMRNLTGYGNMTVAFNEFPAGTDIAPLLKGLKNDSCHCPHWGYMLQGEIVMKYDNGTEETLSEGDVFYMQPGHTALVTKDMKLLDFSPTKELDEVLAHIAKKDGGDGRVKLHIIFPVISFTVAIQLNNVELL